MSYGTPQYTAPPPSYDAESQQPLLNSNDDDDLMKTYVANSSKEVRLQFVRKVYSILAAQLFATSLLSSVYMYNEGIRSWVQTNQWMMIVSMIGTIGVLVALFFKSKSYPLNYGLLGLFTLLEGHAVGTIVTFYNQKLVLQALLMTLGLFIGLTLFTLQSKWDFSGLGPFLYAGLWILIIAGFVQMFFPFSRGIELAFTIAGIVIFSAYILFDTYLIFNRYSPEDYILASISLYLDFINLFLRILQLLDTLNRD